MAFKLPNNNDPERKRSQSLPATNNGITDFLYRRNSSDGGESSCNISKKKKRKGSRMENLEEELNSIMEALPIPFEKPKPRYSTDFPTPEVFPEETWKNAWFAFFERAPEE
ncbi:hypothetical protein CDAR_531271 [Caerostris darwini]|uniref:Uncharacterized protein n=1 Tax=Caerostris darwini TaxID=1538125 RepID=A0AAV4MXP1_9ARAC|nr:hypothetical protein CDAR_531271 [Caerostris darwini]